jgi:hypothetical protein
MADNSITCLVSSTDLIWSAYCPLKQNLNISKCYQNYIHPYCKCVYVTAKSHHSLHMKYCNQCTIHFFENTWCIKNTILNPMKRYTTIFWANIKKDRGQTRLHNRLVLCNLHFRSWICSYVKFNGCHCAEKHSVQHLTHNSGENVRTTGTSFPKTDCSLNC